MWAYSVTGSTSAFQYFKLYFLHHFLIAAPLTEYIFPSCSVECFSINFFNSFLDGLFFTFLFLIGKQAAQRFAVFVDSFLPQSLQLGFSALLDSFITPPTFISP